MGKASVSPLTPRTAVQRAAKGCDLLEKLVDVAFFKGNNWLKLALLKCLEVFDDLTAESEDIVRLFEIFYYITNKYQFGSSIDATGSIISNKNAMQNMFVLTLLLVLKFTYAICCEFS